MAIQEIRAEVGSAPVIPYKGKTDLRPRRNFGIVVFPGTWSDIDFVDVLTMHGQNAYKLMWRETDLGNPDCIIIPGGFAYGDYLRPGAIARFTPIMEKVIEFANDGGIVIGSCNGFQVLTEAGLLPGALLKNYSLKFRCQWIHIKVENNDTRFTALCQKSQVLKIPISHGDGRYYADPDTLKDLNRHGQVLFRYCDENGQLSYDVNPNGSLENIAGIMNKRGNVFGLMPHPERACNALIGKTDGIALLSSLIDCTAT